MSASRGVGAIALAFVAAAGCFPDFDGLTGGALGDAADASVIDETRTADAPRPEADASLDAGAAPDCSTCDASADAAEVKVDPCRTDGASRGIHVAAIVDYCIDETEVTNGAYAKFLAAEVDGGTPQQPPFCSWNTKLSPNDPGWPHPGLEDFPVSQIDWCDAWSYCKWAGKRLCGKIGAGDLADIFATNADRSQWYRACAGASGSPYPYGGTYDPRRCNGVDNVPPQVREVHSTFFPDCQGHEPGLFDMSGNVYEWIDVCETTVGADDQCRMMGGGFNSPSYELACDYRALLPRNNTMPNVGFRCCTDL